MIPEDRKYSDSHEWGLLEGDVVTMGITDFAVRHLSDLVYIQLPEVGDAVEQGDRLGEVESVKAVSDISATVSGEVIEVNSAVVDSLDLITGDCYNDGWLVKIQMEDASELENLLTPEDYNTQVEKEEEEDDDDDFNEDDE